MEAFERQRQRKAEQRARKKRSRSKKKYQNISSSISTQGPYQIETRTIDGRVTESIVTDKRNKKSSSYSRKISNISDLSKKELSVLTPTNGFNNIQKEAKTKLLKPKIVDVRTNKTISEGNFKLDKDFDRRYNIFQKSQTRNRLIAINNAKEYLLATGENNITIQQYSPQQLIQIAAARNLSNSIELRTKLKAIDNKKNINKIQKEIAKRKLLGIKNEGQFLKKIKNIKNAKREEIKNSLNQMTAPNIRKDPFYRLDIKNKKLNSWFEIQRQKAIKGNKNAKAALLGIISLPTNFIESFGGIVIGVVEMALNPIDTVKAIANLKVSDIRQAGVRLGKRIERGEPGALTDVAAEIVTQKYGLGIKKSIKKARQLSPYYVKVNEFVGATPQQIGMSKQLIKATGRKNVKAYSVSRSKIKDLFKNKDFIEVEPALGGADRVYYWAENLVPSLKFTLGGSAKYKGKRIKGKTKEQAYNKIENIITKETGLNKPQIKKLVKKYGEDHFYFGNNQVYSYYALPRKGGKGEAIVLIQDKGILKFNKSINSRIKQVNKLTNQQKIKLRKDINLYIKNNPGKLALSPRTLGKGFGEFELVVPPKTKLYKLKNLRTYGYNIFGLKKGSKFTYLEQADTFIEIAEATLKKKLNKPTLKNMINDFKVKFKKKYNKTQMKKDVKKWYKENFTKEGKKIKKQKKKEILKQEKKIMKERGIIKRKKSTRKPTARKPTVRKPTTRKPTTRNPTTRKPTTRKPTTRKPTTRKPTTRKPTTRKPTTRKPTTRKPTPRKPTPRKIPKIKLNIESKNVKNKVLVFQAKYRERRNENKLYNPKTNPRVTKTITKTTTRNRMIKFVAQKVLKNLARSFNIKIKGSTNKKIKDINLPNELKSFRKSKLKNPLVLKYVQKRETLLKTASEKREIKRIAAKKKKKTPSRRKSKVSKVTKKKKSSNIKRKAIKSVKSKKN
jgi:hypothetical protein